MLKRLKGNKKGFTLIELMIVIAIIGILAAIAIPNFLRYQLKSKTAEAKTNLGAIKTNQEAFRAEWDGYITCAANPAIGTADEIKDPFTQAANDGFSELGYAPSGDVYYTYEVAVGGGTAIAGIAGSTVAGDSGSFCASAASDLDGDAAIGEYAYSTSIAAGMIVTTGTVAGTSSIAGAVEDLAPGVF